jgi:hypothetical protein
LPFPLFFPNFIRLKKCIVITVSLLIFACAKKQNEPVVGDIERNSPSEVTYLRASSTSTLLELSWKDPSDKDLEEVEIVWNSNSYRVPKGNQYFALDNAALNIYNFRVRTVDNKGNASYGVPITNQIDYRLKYCGNFKFTQFESFYSVGNNTTTYYPTTAYNGYVALDQNTADKLIIRYRDGANACTCNNDSVYGGYFKPVTSTGGVFTYTTIQAFSLTSDLIGSFVNKDSLAFRFTVESEGNISAQDVKGKRIN